MCVCVCKSTWGLFLWDTTGVRSCQTKQPCPAASFCKHTLTHTNTEQTNTHHFSHLQLGILNEKKSHKEKERDTHRHCAILLSAVSGCRGRSWQVQDEIWAHKGISHCDFHPRWYSGLFRRQTALLHLATKTTRWRTKTCPPCLEPRKQKLNPWN